MCFSFPLCFLECFYWRDREEIQHHRPGLWLVPQVAPGSQFGLGSTGRLGGMASLCAGALCTGGECHYCIPHLLPAVLVHGQASFSKCMKPGRRWVAKWSGQTPQLHPAWGSGGMVQMSATFCFHSRLASGPAHCSKGDGYQNSLSVFTIVAKGNLVGNWEE